MTRTAETDQREIVGETLDTFVKLRADLAEEDAERHAQRIAVIDMEIERLIVAKSSPLPIGREG